MTQVQDMLRTHPRNPQIDMDALVKCIEECFSCAQTCTSCADACLGEQNVQEMVQCIRYNLDCVDVCDATGRVLSRQTQPHWNLIRSQLQACVTACQVCGAECGRYAAHMDYCKVCAEACRRCEEACNQLLSAVSA
jgi:hypothetical protein